MHDFMLYVYLTSLLCSQQVSPQQMVGLSCSGETMTPQCHIATTAQTIINFHPDCVWIPKDCSPKVDLMGCYGDTHHFLQVVFSGFFLFVLSTFTVHLPVL